MKISKHFDFQFCRLKLNKAVCEDISEDQRYAEFLPNLFFFPYRQMLVYCPECAKEYAETQSTSVNTLFGGDSLTKGDGIAPLPDSFCAVASTPESPDDFINAGPNANLPSGSIQCSSTLFTSTYFCLNCVDYADDGIPMGTLIGIIAGTVIAVLILVAIGIFFWQRRRAKKKQEEAEKMAKVVVLEAPVPPPLYGDDETDLNIEEGGGGADPYRLPGAAGGKTARHAGAYANPDLGEYGLADYGASPEAAYSLNRDIQAVKLGIGPRPQMADPQAVNSVPPNNQQLHTGQTLHLATISKSHSSGSKSSNQPARRMTHTDLAPVVARIEQREASSSQSYSSSRGAPPPPLAPAPGGPRTLKPEASDTFGESSSEATADNPYGYNYSATGASSWAHSSQYEPRKATHAVGGFTGPYPVTKKKKKDKEAKTPKQRQAAALGVGTVGSWKERQQTPKVAPTSPTSPTSPNFAAPTSPKKLTETTMSPFRRSLLMAEDSNTNKFAMPETRSFDEAKKEVKASPKAQGSFMSTNTSTPRAETSVPTTPESKRQPVVQRSSHFNKRVSVDKPLLEITRPVAASKKQNPGYPTG